jgi:hypothetical protein
VSGDHLRPRCLSVGWTKRFPTRIVTGRLDEHFCIACHPTPMVLSRHFDPAAASAAQRSTLALTGQGAPPHRHKGAGRRAARRRYGHGSAVEYGPRFSRRAGRRGRDRVLVVHLGQAGQAGATVLERTCRDRRFRKQGARPARFQDRACDLGSAASKRRGHATRLIPWIGHSRRIAARSITERPMQRARRRALSRST